MSASTTPSGPPRLLLVDDNKLGLAARKVVLEELGFDVQTSLDAKEALALIACHPFDLVITDYKMPSMCGTEFIREVRQMRPTLPVILISGFVDALGLDERNTGADAVISKSSNEVQHLIRTVRSLLKRPSTKKPAGSEGGAPRHGRRGAQA